MRIIRDGILLCDDCLFAAVNGDVIGVSDIPGITAAERIAEIEQGLEFTISWCDCCGAKSAGQRHEFAILGG